LARRNSDSADHSHYAPAPLNTTVRSKLLFFTNQWRKHITKYLAAALLTTALFTCTASAQTASNKTAAADSAAADRAASHKEGEWRASKLVGVNVYNDANERSVTSMMSSWTRRARSRTSSWGLAVSWVWASITAVAYDKLKWSNEPPRSTTASTTTSTTNRPATNVDSNARTAADGTATTTGAATATAEDRKANGYWYPDHAVYNATKDQLKAMPQFKY
jgi:hypothetical protein